LQRSELPMRGSRTRFVILILSVSIVIALIIACWLQWVVGGLLTPSEVEAALALRPRTMSELVSLLDEKERRGTARWAASFKDEAPSDGIEVWVRSRVPDGRLSALNWIDPARPINATAAIRTIPTYTVMKYYTSAAPPVTFYVLVDEDDELLGWIRSH
jgi:hypothetical protein